MSEQEPSTLDLSPSKEVYQAVKSDVTPVSAIKELVDNALDNWERVSSKFTPLHVEVEYYEKDGKLVIRDDSGGVPPEDISMLFALGASKKENIPGAIGAYGIGAKKAIVNLGKEAIIKSRHEDAEEAVGFQVDEQWLNDESNWEVSRQTFNDLEPGITEIHIYRLNFDSWGNLAPTIREELRHTYQLFLGAREWHRGDRGTLSITVDGDELDPPEPINWSFTPFDGLYPRRYENIDLTEGLPDEEYDEPVTLSLTVGLLQKGDEESAGTDIYCQHRQVLRSAEDERAGYGELRAPTGQHKRLRVILEFETKGDAERLPWDTQKNDIDPYNPLAQKAYDWVGRAVKPYFEADHEAVPQTVLRPYGRDSRFAANHGEIESSDYHGRKRVTDKADGDFPEISSLLNMVETHTFLRIYCTDNLKKPHIPAYEQELIRQFAQRYDVDSKNDVDLVETPEIDVEMYIDNDGRVDLEQAIADHVLKAGIAVIDDLDPGLAEFELSDALTERIQQQINERIFCPSLKNWQLPSYLYHYSSSYQGGGLVKVGSGNTKNPYEPNQHYPEESKREYDQPSVPSGESTNIEEKESSVGSESSVASRSTDPSTDKSQSSLLKPSQEVGVGQELDIEADKTAQRSKSSDLKPKRIHDSEGTVVIDLTESEWSALRVSLDLPSDTPREEAIRILVNRYL